MWGRASWSVASTRAVRWWCPDCSNLPQPLCFICRVGGVETPFRITSATLDVMEAFLASSGELHGFAVARAAGKATGSVYPILARLEQAGWLESRWETEHPEAGRPRRRFYFLTDEGAVASRATVLERRGALPAARGRGWLRPALRLTPQWVSAR